MGTFLQTLFVGLRLGSVYALIALGYTMVYGIIRLINFAHGDFIMVGGYTLVFTVPILTAAGLPAWTAVILGFVDLRPGGRGGRAHSLPPRPQEGHQHVRAHHGHSHEPAA